MKKNTPAGIDLFSTSQDRKRLRDAFYIALEGLTDTQQAAVKHIDGPVMVLAGPGTGKTQVFAARFGYILDQTDTQINQILCLTYSEAGVQAMRDRLLQFIGPAAHEAHIYTYHSFCNKVINENPEYFFDFKKMKLASPLQRYELIEEILLELPDDSRVKRIIGDRHFEIKRFDNQYDNIKKEEKNANELISETLRFIDEEMHLKPKYHYVKDKSKTNADYAKDKGRFYRTVDVLKTYEEYLKKMKERSWIDFNDMLIHVKDAFKKHPDLLARYQEQYLYFLIDEFQDTSAIQNNIVIELVNFWESPNLFIVGDDDQAIYRFQGANEQNLLQIFDQFPNMAVYCITKNFRSTQSILDCANHVIEKLMSGRIHQHFGRIPSHILEKINKKLISAKDSIQVSPPSIKMYESAQQETLAVFDFVRKKHLAGEDLSETAILCRRIKTIQDLLYLLELESIPVNLKLGKDILDQPFVNHFILLLQYLDAEFKEYTGGEPYLLQLLYLPYWGLNTDDISMISFLERKNRDRKELVSKILNPHSWPAAEFRNKNRLIEFVSQLQEWKRELPPVKTLSSIVEDIFRKSGLLQWALHSPESTWHLRCINTLFNHIRSISTSQPHIALHDYLAQLTKMKNFDLALTVEAGYTHQNGVNILTAHSAKGQEYETVWIMNAQRAEWEDFGAADQSGYKLPDHMSQIEQIKANKPIDERRLFYVAMTRAKHSLIISWPNTNDAEMDKQNTPSQFVSDVLEFIKGQPNREVIDQQLVTEKIKLISNKKEAPAELFNHQIIEEYCQDLVMTASILNTYLDCPVRFYFEEILKVPQLDNAHLGLGISLHEGLHEFFLQYLKNPSFDPEYLIEFFIQSLHRNEWYFTKDEYDGLIRKFRNLLPKFLAQNEEVWKNVKDYKLEYFIENVLAGGLIPMKGKIDQVLSYGDQSTIIDFKSGQGDSSGATKKLPERSSKSEGGEYWRQAMFYNILFAHDKSKSWNVAGAKVLFLQTNKLEPSKFESRSYKFESQENTIAFIQLLQQVYEDIKAHKVTQGCNKPECEWCEYTKQLDSIQQRK